MRSTSIVTLLIVAPLGVCLPGVSERAQVESKSETKRVAVISTQDRTTILSKVEAALEGKTRVPLRWPSFIPDATDEAHPLYVNLLSISQTSYDLELGWTADCTGGNNCHYGAVRGSAAPLAENEGVRVPVTLLEGIKGYFIDAKCDAHCDDSAVGWAEGGYHYSISIKAEKKQSLVKCANSAIASALPRQGSRRH
jgi:hypothetical protein